MIIVFINYRLVILILKYIVWLYLSKNKYMVFDIMNKAKFVSYKERFEDEFTTALKVYEKERKEALQLSFLDWEDQFKKKVK